MTCAVLPSTTILAASASACDCESSAAKDTVNPLAVLSGSGGGAVLVESAGGAPSESTCVVSVSVVKRTGWSSPAARGRNPVHVNGYQKSDAPPDTRCTSLSELPARNTMSSPRLTT